jgi:peroxiredoxin
VIAVRDHRERFGNAQPVVVTFAGDPARLGAYTDHLQLASADIPLLADPARELYHYLGATRGRLSDVWSIGTLRMYARLLRRGRRLRMVRDDTRQLGADAIVDADGRLTHVWLPDGPDHRPSIAEILAVLDRL